mgnify:FL=1
MRTPAITADEYIELVIAGVDHAAIIRLAQYRQTVRSGRLSRPEER